MSLFGDDNDAPASRARSSLFDDNAASKMGGSSMFGDDDDSNTPASGTAAADDSSPWGFTPKKSAGRGSLVKSLLADADVPEAYIDRFDAMQAAGNVSGSEARRLLEQSGISGSAQQTVWEIVSGKGELSRLGRGEFNVLLALVGLAQEGEELGLDAVDERRRKLPVPRLPELRQQQAPATPQMAGQDTSQSTSVARSNGGGAQTQSSYGSGGFGESDPWGSPGMHKGHGHLNGSGSHEPRRTTSTFTTTAAEPSDAAGSGSFSNTAGNTNETSSWAGGNSYGAGGAEGFGGSSATGGGFGGDEGSNPIPTRPVATTRNTGKGVEEVVTVNLLDEKEGMFMFQHRNYEVSSVRRNSKVIRRYSDFVWLLDCLHKRYPFRQLPLLPPKRVQINGNHIAADSTFLEKRRRGLARFANSLVRHPVLREEQLVVMFLTVPTVDAGPTAS